MAADQLLHGRIEVLNAERHSIESEAAQAGELFGRRDAWVHLDGDLGSGNEVEVLEQRPV